MTIDNDTVFPVYITKEVIDGIAKICKKNKNEVFGYLVGERYKWKEQDYIVLNHFLYIKGAVHGNEFSVHERDKRGIADDVEFNFVKYSEEFNKLKEKEQNEKLLRLGWWHSHPNFGLFLSSTDLTTQREIFPEAFHVALVVDPIQDIFTFFTLDKKSKDGYKEIDHAVVSL